MIADVSHCKGLRCAVRGMTWFAVVTAEVRWLVGEVKLISHDEATALLVVDPDADALDNVAVCHDGEVIENRAGLMVGVITCPRCHEKLGRLGVPQSFLVHGLEVFWQILGSIV